jgi:hypothetical protein
MVPSSVPRAGQLRDLRFLRVSWSPSGGMTARALPSSEPVRMEKPAENLAKIARKSETDLSRYELAARLERCLQPRSL